MSSEGRNPKAGGNPTSDLYKLQAINRVYEAVKNVATEGTLGNVNSTLISILNAVAISPDIEVLLVRDTVTGIVYKQITDYASGIPNVIYEDVDGNVVVPVNPLEYLDPGAVLNIILAQIGTVSHTLVTINTSTDGDTGTVPINSVKGSVLNYGNADGIWNGKILPAGVSMEWGSIGVRDNFAAIPYDATGTTFIIEYTI